MRKEIRMKLNSRIYMKKDFNEIKLNKFIFIGIFILFFSLFNLNNILAEDNSQYISENIKNNIYQSIDLYYYYFISENLNEYLNTQYLNTLTNKELDLKKANILKLWERNKYGYLLDDKDNFIYSVNGSIAYIEYNITNNVFDLDYNEISSNKVQMSAILVKINDTWKILNIIPTSLFNENVESDLLSINIKNKNENMSENISNKDVNNKSIIKDEGMAKYPTKLIQHNNYCKLKINLSKYSNINLPKIKHIDSIINNNSIIELKIDSLENYYKYINNQLILINKTDNFDYYIYTNACVVNRIIENNSIAMEEYKKGNIKITGTNLVNKIKIGVGNFIFKFLTFFNFI